MNHSRLLGTLSLLGMMLGASAALAQVPETMSFQGKIVVGTKAPDGAQTLTLRIYNSDQGGTPLWSETQTARLHEGLFNLVLGNINPLRIPFNEKYWIGITIADGAEMSPRLELTSAPYAQRAGVANSLEGGAVASINGATGPIRIIGGGSISVMELDGTIIIKGGADIGNPSLQTALDDGAQFGGSGGDIEGTYDNLVIRSTAGNHVVDAVNDAATTTQIDYSKVNLANSIVEGDLVDGAVTSTKVSSQTAASGTALVSNGDGTASWQTPAAGSLILPYEVAQSYDDAELLSITNNGANGAARFQIRNPLSAGDVVSVVTDGTGNALALEGGIHQYGGGVVFEAFDATSGLYWNSAISALRAGTRDADQWDTSAGNVGAASIGLGRNVTASGEASMAIGNATHASGYAALATGDGSTASGDYSTALGYASQATGGLSIAGGNQSQATSDGAFAMGYQAQAFGNYAVALGINPHAHGNASVAIGNSSEASQDNSIAIGMYTQSNGANSIALGNYASTDGKTGSVVIGDNSATQTSESVKSTADNQFKVRATGGTVFHTDVDMTDGRSVFIAPDGNVGLGVAAPAAKLDVAGTATMTSAIAGDATLRVTNTGDGGAAYFHVENDVEGNDVLNVVSSGAGVAGRFHIDNLENGNAALSAQTDGTGAAGGFYITSEENSSQALDVNTQGTGPAISAYSQLGIGLRVQSNVAPAIQTIGDVNVTGTSRISGNLGVGLTSPAERLDVNGNIKASGSFIGNGSGLTNVSAGQLLMPFSQSANTGSSPMFQLTQSGTGPAISAGGSILFSGTSGVTPASGAGTRMMWVPSKAAFRAGAIDGTQWDAANIGQWSTAIGQNGRASGDGAVALGSGASATNASSVAIGLVSSASGQFATAIGRETQATATHAVAMGFASQANGYSSTAFGESSKANGGSSIAGGLLNEARADFSVALGRSNIATAGATHAFVGGFNNTVTGNAGVAFGQDNSAGQNGFAMGGNSHADGFMSTAVGDHASATGWWSTALGSYASTNGQFGSFVYGDHSTAGQATPAVVSNTAPDQFMVRASGGTIFYSDAATTASKGVFIKSNDGSLGIGVASPTAKLDVNGSIKGSGNLDVTGVISGNGSGISNISGANVSGNITGNAAGFTGSLAGDVTGTQSSTAVSLVGGVTAANVASGATAANAATALNTASTIVRRDASGNFAAGTITAGLSGNVTGNVTGNLSGHATSATTITGNLSGEVTSTGMTTTIAPGSVTSAKISNGTILPEDLAADAVETAAIKDGAVTPFKIALPYSRTIADAGTLWSVINTGTGGAGEFRVNNGASSANALFAVTNGSGNALFADGRITQQNGSVLFNGANGATPVSGSGVRMMWIPSKRSFRAGEVGAGEWDDANIGVQSVAMGFSTKASAQFSTALGRGTQAVSAQATALGFGTTASGISSTAMGEATTAGGGSSTAMGFSTTASGEFSTAMGRGTQATGTHSTALGYNTVAGGNAAVALGQSTSAAGDNSTALGFTTSATGLSSVAMGRNTTASGNFTTAIGSYASTNGRPGAFVYGDNSTTTVMSASADNQFMSRAAGGYVLYTDAATTAAQAVYIAPGGNVGLGTATPASTLTVNGGMTIKRTAVASGTSYAVQTNDYLIAVPSANTNNTVTVTLPSAATVQSGKIYLIKGERTTGKITVNSTSGTVEGAASFDLSKNQGAQFYSDGSNWWILSLP